MRCWHRISSCPIKNIGWHQCCHLKLLLPYNPTFSVEHRLHPCTWSFPPWTGQIRFFLRPRNCLCVAFSGKVLTQQFCLWTCSNCQNSNEGCVPFKILWVAEKSLYWQITLISNLRSSLLLLPQRAHDKLCDSHCNPWRKQRDCYLPFNSALPAGAYLSLCNMQGRSLPSQFCFQNSLGKKFSSLLLLFS